MSQEAAAFNAVSAAFARAPEQEHSLACLINAAVRLHCRALEAIRRPAVEDWEDGPCGVGMSDKASCPTLRCGDGRDCLGGCYDYGWCKRLKPPRPAPSRPPERDGEAGSPTDYGSGRCGSTGSGTGAASISPTATQTVRTASSPHPVVPERGERVPLPPTHYGPADMLLDDLNKRIRPECQMRTGNALAEERGGIVHLPGSPIAAEFGPSDPAKRRVPKPVNPEDCGDGA